MIFLLPPGIKGLIAIALETIFRYFLETGNFLLFGTFEKLFCDEKLFKVLLYLYVYFVQKIAEVVLKILPLLANGWSYRVFQLLVESHF